MKINLFFYVLVLLALHMNLCHFALATGRGGGDVSGGGYGVVWKGHLQLLDFAENNADENFRFHQNSSILPTHKEFIPFLNDDQNQQMSMVLEYLRQKDALFAEAVSKSIQILGWSFVQLPLKPITSIQTPVQGQIVQIAARTATQVFIDQKMWEKLADPAKNALILHEAIMALASDHVPELRVRQLIGSIYKQSPDSFLKIFQALKTNLPTLVSASKAAPTLVSMAENSDKNRITLRTVPPNPVLISRQIFAFEQLTYYGIYSSVYKINNPIFVDSDQTIIFPFYTIYTKENADTSNPNDLRIQQQDYFDSLTGNESFWNRLCQTFSNPRFKRLSISSYRLQIKFKKIQAQNQPKLDWKLKPIEDYSVESRDGVKARCDFYQRLELNWVKSWIKTAPKIFLESNS